MHNKIFASLLLCTCLFLTSTAQQVLLVSSTGSFHELTITNGVCTIKDMPGFCGNTLGGFSVAQYRNEIYFNTNNAQLYRVNINNPNTCVFTGVSAAGNALTVDKNGTLYWVSGRDLYRLPVGRTTAESVGTLPFTAAGDLIFYNDKLLLAAEGNASTGFESCLVEVNIADPAQSQVYMLTPGLTFFGLVNVSVGCNLNKVYGIMGVMGGSALVELDMENRTVMGTVCTVPINVYDAASMTETGEVKGANIASVGVRPQCDYTAKGSINITASSATPGSALSYSLNNNTVTNNTGTFQGLEAGQYQIRVTTSEGCTRDTFATIEIVDRIKVDIVTVADTCGTQKGATTFTGISGHVNLMYSLNNAAFVAVNQFAGLSSGFFNLRVRDINECYLDTSFSIQNIQPAMPPVMVNITEASCTGVGGAVKVNFTPAMGITAITLNGMQGATMGEFLSLNAGTYQLRLVTSSCNFDSTIVVAAETTDPPTVQYTSIPPNCSDRSNGSISFTVNGNVQPYTYAFNNGPMGTATQFRNLPTGNYPLQVRDGKGCLFQETIAVSAYQKQPFQVTHQTSPTDCWQPEGGRAVVNITGGEAPYFFRINGKGHQSGQEAGGLRPGTHKVYFSNGNNCLLDSMDLVIGEQNTPGVVCDTVYVPTAFTPNADGRNDKLQAITSSATNKFIFRVFNRTGQVIFETSEVGKGWDGRFREQPQPPGVYVWMVTYTNQTGRTRTFKGTTVLIR